MSFLFLALFSSSLLCLHKIINYGSYTTCISALLCRHITTLLEDVVFFVIGKESTGGLQRPDPLTEEGVIIRERQKLLREQYVLKEIFNLLSIPIKGYGGEHEIDCHTSSEL